MCVPMKARLTCWDVEVGWQLCGGSLLLLLLLGSWGSGHGHSDGAGAGRPGQSDHHGPAGGQRRPRWPGQLRHAPGAEGCGTNTHPNG